jgi:hypothetical protein
MARTYNHNWRKRLSEKRALAGREGARVKALRRMAEGPSEEDLRRRAMEDRRGLPSLAK